MYYILTVATIYYHKFSDLMYRTISSVQFSHSVVSDSLQPHEFSTPGLPVHHQLLSSLRLTSIESVMPSSHLILCHPLLLLPPIPPTSESFPVSQLFA